MPKQRTTEEMRAYQAERRARVTPDVTPPQNVTPEAQTVVTPARNVTPSTGVTKTDRISFLRSELARYLMEYRAAQDAASTETHPGSQRLEYARINAARDPLFRELYALGETRGIPPHIANADLVLRH